MLAGERRSPPSACEKHPPLAAEAVELIHVESAEERLHRLVDVAEGDALLQHFVAIDVSVELRHRRGELGRDADQFGPLPRRLEKLLHVLVQEVEAAAGAVLQPEREAALRAKTGNRRRHHGERRGLRHQPAQFHVEMIDDLAGIELRLRSFVPRLEADEIEAVVAGGDARQQAEAGDGVEVGDAFGVGEEIVDLAAHGVGAFERRCRRQLHVQQEVAVVLFGHETGRQTSPNQRRHDGEAKQQHDADERLAHQSVADPDVAVGHLVEAAVEPAEETTRAGRPSSAAAAAAWRRAPATASAR